jgi:hypothetical protein
VFLIFSTTTTTTTIRTTNDYAEYRVGKYLERDLHNPSSSSRRRRRQKKKKNEKVCFHLSTAKHKIAAATAGRQQEREPQKFTEANAFVQKKTRAQYTRNHHLISTIVRNRLRADVFFFFFFFFFLLLLLF